MKDRHNYKDKHNYIDGNQFHSEIRRVYFGSYGWAVNKKIEDMAHVVYEPAHENALFDDNRRGNGKDFATWIFSEEPGLEENLFESDFELMIDASLEPNASIGLHSHHNTEEIYYVIEGKIHMTTLDRDGKEFLQELFSGDAHFVRRGQSHYGIAGPEGVRFIAVAMRVRK
jgi:mannose-6-phosphate isomerase-like protein (cupin superfamily)